MNRKRFRAHTWAVLLAAACSGGEGDVIYTKHLADGSLVEVTKNLENITGNEDAAVERQTWSIMPSAEYAGRFLSGTLTVEDVDAVPRYPKTGAARTFSVLFSRPPMQQRVLIRKFAKFLNWDFVRGDPPRDPIPDFHVYDVAMTDGTFHILLAHLGFVQLARIPVQDATNMKPGPASTAICFAEHELPACWPIRRAVLLPTSQALYILFVSESGKHALWAVPHGDHRAKQVWINDPPTPPNAPKPPRNDEPPPDKPRKLGDAGDSGTCTKRSRLLAH